MSVVVQTRESEVTTIFSVKGSVQQHLDRLKREYEGLSPRPFPQIHYNMGDVYGYAVLSHYEVTDVYPHNSRTEKFLEELERVWNSQKESMSTRQYRTILAKHKF